MYRAMGSGKLAAENHFACLSEDSDNYVLALLQYSNKLLTVDD